MHSLKPSENTLGGRFSPSDIGGYGYGALSMIGGLKLGSKLDDICHSSVGRSELLAIAQNSFDSLESS